MVHGSWSMGMRADAHTGPLKLPGHGRHMGPMGNAHGKAYWTANVQAGMCTRVARGVSVTLFLPNCAIRQAGQRRVHGARSSVRLCAGVRGHGISLDGTDARARSTACLARMGRSTARPSVCVVDRSTARPPFARVRLLVGLARMGRSSARPSVCACNCDCASARVRLRLWV